MRISERVPVEVTEGVAVIVFIFDTDLLPLIESDGDEDDVFDTDDEPLIVDVLYIVRELREVVDIVDRLVDVLDWDADFVTEVVVDEVLDIIGETVSEELCEEDLLAAAELVNRGLWDLEEDIVIDALELIVLLTVSVGLSVLLMVPV